MFREYVTATLEIIRPGVGIVELTSSKGEWKGGCKVEIKSRNPQDVYEEAYNVATVAANAHGLELERFSWA